MLAQQNSKQKSIFFNLKPTVIDKLISKNKCSIQNSQFFSNEESDESLSVESEESSSSSRESSVAAEEVQGSSKMAPMKRNSKVGVLGSKLSAKVQIAMKRKPGRPPGSLGKKGAKQKLTTVKKILETRKGRTPKVEKEVQETVKKKRAIIASPSSESVKRPRNSQRQEITLSPKKDKSLKSPDELSKNSKKKRSDLVSGNNSKNKSPRKTMQNANSEMLPSVNNQSSPRKFPSNVTDHWKTTGLVIRGRGRSRGVSSCARGSRIKRGALRGDRYITRDSQVTGLMRSGKMRKLSDPNLVEGLESFQKRRSFVNRIKLEKGDCLSDEQSSFVTTSELSFGDNENSLSKLSDDDISTPGTPKVKVEDTEDESTTDTNSNLFRNKSRKTTSLEKLSRADVSQGFDQGESSTNSLGQRKTPMQRGRGRRKLMLSDVKTLCPPSAESSPGSPSLTNSPKSGFKRQKRKHDGSWVRRSTRSVAKTTDEEESGSEVMQELLKEKGEAEDTNITSKCSLSINSEVAKDHSDCSSDVLMKIVCEDRDKSNQIETKVAVIEPPIDKSSVASSQAINALDNVSQEERSETVSADGEKNKISNLDAELEDNSLVDFTLELEESPVKTPFAPNVKEVKVDAIKLNFNSATTKNESENLEICDNSLGIVQSSCTASKFLTEISSSNEIISCSNEDSLLEETKNTTAKDGPSDLLITNSVSLTMENLLTEKSVETSSNDQEVLSDENILSMIDSFCHSDTSDFTIDEDAQKIPEHIEQKNSVDSKLPHSQAKILEDSEKPNVESAVTPLDENTKSNKSSIPEENATDFTEDFEEIDTSEENAELQDIKFPSVKTEINLFREVDEKEEKKVEDLDDKMETDFVTEVSTKSVDSTEESSSSDSNSHLMQLVPTHLKNELDDHSIEKLSNLPIQTKEQDVEMNIAESTPDTSEADGEQTDKTKDNTISESSSAENKISHEYSIMRALPDSNVGSTQEMPSKELLSALGLQSLHSAPEEKPKRPNDSYTGTLKAVIKLNRSSDKKSGGRKIIFKQGDKLTEDLGGGGDRLEYRICSSEVSTLLLYFK